MPGTDLTDRRLVVPPLIIVPGVKEPNSPDSFPRKNKGSTARSQINVAGRMEDIPKGC
jgi:hypothetical protein